MWFSNLRFLGVSSKEVQDIVGAVDQCLLIQNEHQGAVAVKAINQWELGML